MSELYKRPALFLFAQPGKCGCSAGQDQRPADFTLQTSVSQIPAAKAPAPVRRQLAIRQYMPW